MDVRLMVAVAVALASAGAHGQNATKGDPARGQQIATQVCAACHGADGNSPAPVNPVLSAQHPQYTLKQLMNFKSEGGKAAERPNAIMTPIANGLSADDMANLSVYFATQKPKPSFARDPELVKLGAEIFRGGILKKGVAACASCHGPNGAGVPAQFPRLAGQHAQYTIEELRAFRAGERANDPGRMMRLTAEKMSDREIAAVAEYIQGLR